MNILWHSDPLWYPTGYGIQAAAIVPRLIAAGHDVKVVMPETIPSLVYHGVEHLAGFAGGLAVIEWAHLLGTDLVVCLGKAPAFPRGFARVLSSKWAAILPIEQDPVSPGVLRILENYSYAIAISPFAQRELTRCGLSPVYLPHGVDTRVFTPGRKTLPGAEDKFVVGIVASNSFPEDVKGWDLSVQAFGRFHRRHPDSVLRGHATPLGSGSPGVDIVGMAHAAGFEIQLTDPWLLLRGLSSTWLAGLYQGFDVLLSLSRVEGFCVPLIEAQACGKPVISTDWAARRDLVGSGWKIPPVGDTAYWATANVDAAAESLEEAYRLWSKGKLERRYAAPAREFAERFDHDVIFERYWLPFLERVEAEA